MYGAPVAWFSPTYKMLLEVWRNLANVLQPAATRINVQERRIELVTNGLIEMWSLENPDAVRGRKYKRVVIDEAAIVPGFDNAWNMVIRPTLMDLHGDAWFLSTPKGMNGFWRLYQKGQDPQETDWKSWKLPTSANPYIMASEIEAARRSLPELVYTQEILAEFLPDAAGVFRRVMDAATVIEQAGAISGHHYIMGVDLARRVDFTVCIVMDISVQPAQAVYMDRFNEIAWEVQVGRIKALVDRFGIETMIVDQTGVGDPIVEQLQRETAIGVTGYQFTNATKAVAVESLALAFERGEIGIIPDPMLIAELQAFESERLPSGMVRYAAPPGMHDDTVMSLALAYQGLGYSGSWITLI